MKRLKSSLTVRGDSLYCPLPFSLDTYGNCLTDCWHCYFRNLNKVWGEDLKPADLTLMEKTLSAGLKNKNPKTPVAHMLCQKKTIRLGNKADPFQDAENKYRITRQAINLLVKYDWTFVLQTRHTSNMMEAEKNLFAAKAKNIITIMPIVSPGMDKDWEVLERKRTTMPMHRLKISKYLIMKGFPLGVNGEPFIPGFHTVREFEDVMKLLKFYHIPSYNTYNFHFNAFVAKRLHALGIDIEKIWYYNRDEEWKKILPKLLDLSVKYGIRLGCPDFVNTGKDWIEQANTCCGINVPNPATFNTHVFKRLKQEGKTTEEIIQLSYDGAGNMEKGVNIIEGNKSKFYTLKDAGL